MRMMNKLDSSKDKVIKGLRPGDLIGLCQQPGQQSYEVIQCHQQKVLAVNCKRFSLRLIAVEDITPPF